MWTLYPNQRLSPYLQLCVSAPAVRMKKINPETGEAISEAEDRLSPGMSRVSNGSNNGQSIEDCQKSRKKYGKRATKSRMNCNCHFKIEDSKIKPEESVQVATYLQLSDAATDLSKA